jgi:hypothetical protein
VGQEGLDLVGGRGVAVEEVAALGHQGRGSGRQGRQVGAIACTVIVFIDESDRGVHCNHEIA